MPLSLLTCPSRITFCTVPVPYDIVQCIQYCILWQVMYCVLVTYCILYILVCVLHRILHLPTQISFSVPMLCTLHLYSIYPGKVRMHVMLYVSRTAHMYHYKKDGERDHIWTDFYFQRFLRYLGNLCVT